MTRKTRRTASRLLPEDRKSEILKVARKVLSEVQHENFMPSTVAERYGVSEGTIYRYYPTKHDLLMAVAEQWMEEMMAIEREVSELTDTFSRLRTVIHQSLEVVRTEPSITRFIFMAVRIDANYRNTRLYRLIAKLTSYTTHVIEDGIAKGIFRNDFSPTLIRDVIFGAVEHQTWPFLRNEVGPPLAKVADDIAELIYRGLAVSPPVKTEVVAQAIERISATLDGIHDELSVIQQNVNIPPQTSGNETKVR